MLAKMLVKTQGYLDKALKFDTLFMSTILPPYFCIKFFQKWFAGRDSAISMKAGRTLNCPYKDYQYGATKQCSPGS